MPETEEQRRKRLEQAGAMVGAAQGPLNLGTGGSIPAFPTNFSNINPEQRTNPIRFGGGGTATMGLGGANVEYPSRLTLSGGAYGPREMGARDFAPATLPQTQPQQMLRQYTDNPFATPAQRFAPTLTQGLNQLPPTDRLPIEQGPLSMNISAPRSAEAQGRQVVQTPYGTIFATQQQAANMMTPRTMAQQSTRSPAEQQALLAQMRERGAAIGQRLATEESKRQQESIQRGYAFRQGLVQAEAQRALTPVYGEGVTRGAAIRGAQAEVEAERWKQAQAGRNPMSQEPLSALGLQFQRGSMGQYSPTRSVTAPSGLVPSGGPQPATSMQTMPSITGSIASGFLPTFANAGSTVAGSAGYASYGLPRTGNQVEDWWRENYPQDYSVNQYGIGRRMIARRTPFEQNILL